ncbi:MAG: hypothetical protein ACP5KV_03345 [Candidatus Methanomethylicaceae archaeon]
MEISSDVKQIIGDLIRVLMILRKTSPGHSMSEDQRKVIIESLDRAKTRLERIREGMLR